LLAIILVATASACANGNDSATQASSASTDGSRSKAAVRVQLTVTSYFGGKKTITHFTLGCSPESGTLPLRASVCRDIAAHRQAMLAPRHQMTTCSGGPEVPVVQVDVVQGAKGSRFGGMVGCGWPGGTPLAIYFDASRNDARVLRLDSARLRCEDDPAFFAKPTPWASINACTHGLWTPAAERDIRRAEAARQLTLLHPRSLFPADPGVVRCRIPAGGPTTRTFYGLCGTDLTGPASRKLVHFVETWAQGKRIFRHHWTLRGTTLISQSGPVPPQLWD
jgi:hypothetical protein